MSKDQNNQIPVMDAIGVNERLRHGGRLGHHHGLDSDTPSTADDIIAFIEASHIPLLTINLLQALPENAVVPPLAGR